MSTWNELWRKERIQGRFTAPEADVHRFISLLETAFPNERPLRIWDLCCGSGRHTGLVARLGHAAYATDNAPEAVALARKALEDEGLACLAVESEMQVCPWPDIGFHGVVAWG